MFQKMPNTLVKTQPFFKIPPCLQQRILFKFNQTLLAWDFMDYIIPDLSMAYNISFDESVMKQNLKRSTAIYNSIQTKFVPKYREFFFRTLYLRIGAVGLTGNKSYGALKKLFVRLRLLSCPARCQHFWIWISFVLQLVQLKIVRFQICLTMLNSLLFLVVIMENIPIWTGSIWSALHLLRLKCRMPRPVCC